MTVSRSTTPKADASCNSGSPLRRYRWYQRLHAWALSLGNSTYEQAIDEVKQDLIGSLSGQILEIGPGAGANMPYINPESTWIGVEPNIHAHPYLENQAARFGIQATLLEGMAESLPIASGSVDAVVCSLVLCTVPHPERAIQEIIRVLRPGGKFVFIEHVAAAEGTRLRKAQQLLRKPHAVIADGCCTDRDTGSLIRSAGFSLVVLEERTMPVPLVSPHVMGFAIR